MNSDMCYQITSPYFTAGIEVAQDGVVVKAAPIVKYLGNTNIAWVRNYCQKKGWLLEAIETPR